MGRWKSLISVLQFLIVTYHMFRLTVVITHKPSRIRPSSVTSWATISVLWLSRLIIVSTNKSTAHLGSWKSRQGYFCFQSIWLNVSWKEETSGLDKIYALTQSYSEGRVARKPITAIFSR